MRFSILLASCLLLLGAAVFWLFGWRSEDQADVGVVRYQRFFGRYTEVTVDADRDGSADVEVRYRWSDPYIGNVNDPCGDSFVEIREDRDFDGNWDTWTLRVAATKFDPCPVRIDADTDADGRADWGKVVSFGRTQDVYADLRSSRGF